MAEEDEDQIKVSCVLLDWAGVEPGVSPPNQGSIPLLMMSLMTGEGDVQNVALRFEQGPEIIMHTIRAMCEAGSPWALKIADALQQATEQGMFNEDEESEDDTDDSEEAGTTEDSDDSSDGSDDPSGDSDEFSGG